MTRRNPLFELATLARRSVNLIAVEMHQWHARPLEPYLYAKCRSEVLKDPRRADVNLSGNLYKLWNRPGGVLPIVPKEL
jgi:hypothetical protein